MEECLLEMNQEVVKVILDCKRDIWKSQELFELVEEYFDNRLHTLDFCAALEKLLKRARDNQLLLLVALQQFDEESSSKSESGESGSKASYKRMLEELRNFKETGDPFTEEFYTRFRTSTSSRSRCWRSDGRSEATSVLVLDCIFQLTELIMESAYVRTKKRKE